MIEWPKDTAGFPQVVIILAYSDFNVYPLISVGNWMLLVIDSVLPVLVVLVTSHHLLDKPFPATGSPLMLQPLQARSELPCAYGVGRWPRTLRCRDMALVIYWMFTQGTGF